jgi:cell division septation protein DedD
VKVEKAPKSDVPKGEAAKGEAPKGDTPKDNAPVAAEGEKKTSRYTLQLSAFQDRSEAEDFAKKIAGSGYKPSIVAADIPGRGIWYRVRVGEFPSAQAALDAKKTFERKQHLIAYVTKL